MTNLFETPTILYLGILLPALAILSIGHWIRYNNTEKIAGEIIIEISMTSKQRIFVFFSYFIFGFFILYLFPQIGGLRKTDNLGGSIYLIISIIGALMFAVVCNKKQKICSRGVLYEQGLILWNNIRKVKISEKQSDIILVFLHEPVSKEYCIKLKCNLEEIQQYIRIIENHIQKEVVE